MAMSTDNGENTVCLIRDQQADQINDGTAEMQLFTKDMNLRDWEPPSNSQLGPGADLSTYMDQLKNNSSNMPLITISIYPPNRICIIKPGKEFVQALYRILPRPFLQIEASFSESTRDGREQDYNFSKRFGLYEMLTSSGSRTQVPLEYLYAAFICGNGRCIFSIRLGWITPQIPHVIQLNPCSLSQSLLENEATKELILVAANGAEIKCHKVIFSAQSPALTAMVTTTGLKECEEGRINFPESSEDGLNLLLRYLYGFELEPKEILCELVVELLQTAHKYDLAHFQESLQKFLLEKDETWFIPDVLLELYFYTREVDEFGRLRDHALLLTTRIKTEVFRSCEGFRKLDPAAASELLGEQIKLFQEGIAK